MRHPVLFNIEVQLYYYGTVTDWLIDWLIDWSALNVLQFAEFGIVNG